MKKRFVGQGLAPAAFVADDGFGEIVNPPVGNGGIYYFLDGGLITETVVPSGHIGNIGAFNRGNVIHSEGFQSVFFIPGYVGRNLNVETIEWKN